MSDLIKRLCRPGYDLQKEQAIQEAIIEIRELRAKVEATPGMMRGAHRLVAAARRVLASADSQGLIRLDESGDVASELRSALAAAGNGGGME